MPLSRVSQAIEEIRRGRAVIMVDDEDRENEGDIVVAADKITPEWVNFMAKHGRGLICLTLTEQRASELDLPMMVDQNSAQYQTAFTVSIEARHGVTTGISAEDRATTIATAVDPNCGPRDLARPGHVFPLVARDGGVLVRTGHTEGSVDLARLAGLTPAGVICEVLKDDGTMARRPDLEEFAREFDLKIVSIADLIHYRRAKEKLVERYVEDELDFVYGRFRTIVYRSLPDGTEHYAFVKGEVDDGAPVLVRAQTAQPMQALHVDLGLPSVLEAPMRRVEAEGRGVIVVIGQPDGGDSIGETLKRRLSGEEMPVPVRKQADQLRDYGVGAQILSDLGVQKMRLMTNTPRRIVGLEGFDLSVEEIVPLQLDRPLATVHPIRDEVGD
ncbi:MAG: 3,4-dihydroxy-2-butanone-4-phosphate synthase [Deltaproteobacteria bacterium]|nr:3,4-dihydroxy-2-butanone-4-phosphate synthase [Deltaproteobacteria bacterium]